MSTVDIYLNRALNKHLSLMTPTINISWENTNYTPVNGVGYLETWLLPIPTQQVTLGPDCWEEFSGIFQVTCVYPTGKGSDPARTKAAAIRSRFKIGTLCTYNSLTVKVKGSYPGPGYYSEDGSWYRVPVSIVYQCFANN